MVQLSKRLLMVTNMVTKGNRVADIGCDHAYTSIYLVEQNISNRIIAMDINKGPLERAKEHVKLYGCAEYIDIRLSDGAKELGLDEADTLLISGMGGTLTIHILEDSYEVVQRVKELILQPQSEIAQVRRYLHSIGFSIIDEDMLIEDGKYYTAVHAIKGEESYEEEIEYSYGRILLQKKNKNLYDFLCHGINKYTEVIAKLETQEYDRNKQRLSELRLEKEMMEKALKHFD